MTAQLRARDYQAREARRPDDGIHALQPCRQNALRRAQRPIAQSHRPKPLSAALGLPGAYEHPGPYRTAANEPRAFKLLVATKFQLPWADSGADTAEIVLSTTGADNDPLILPVPVAAVVLVAATAA